MKRKLLPFLAVCLLFFFQNLPAFSQSILSPGISPVNNLPTRTAVFQSMPGLKKTSTCATDTVNYVYNKTTFLNTISLNNTTSGNSFAQWYPAPQAITVHGFEFYAWQIAGTSAVVSLTCRMYNAGIDSMPVGSPLATVVVNVDSTFGTGLLTTIRKKAIFNTPITTSSSNGYVLTIETSSSINVAVVTNSWTASPPNGHSEWLSSVRIGTTYYRSYNINIGGNPFNADFILQPFVNYNLTANFTSSMNCMSVGTPANFTNTSSPVLFNKFYSVRAFMGIPQFSCLWDYGDTSGSYYAVHGNKTYNFNASYRVTLLDTLYGWMSGCGDQTFKDISQSPDPTNASNNSPICAGGTLRLFADSVVGANYYWTGPNGFTSTQRNPEIPSAGLASTGMYSVITVIGQCSSTVATTYANVINTYTASNNGPLCTGQNLSLNATQINGATYAWTGPNGFSSTLRNPIRSSISKPDSGTYQVSISLSGCGVIGPLPTLVVVNDIPATPVVGSNGPVCVGQTLNLTASGAVGGYNWTGPNNYSSSTQNPVRVSAQNTFAGTYSVTVSANGCTSAAGSVNVVVNPIPAAPTAGNNGPLCSGQSLSLTASLIPNATYTWSGPNSFSSNSQNPTRSGLSTLDGGIYSVIATVSGCASAVANTTVVITSSTPAPTVSGNGPLCPGQNLQLTASGIAGATYSWSGPKNFSATTQNPIINNVNDSMAGIYSVTATTSSCGTSAAATYTLVINTLPSAPGLGNNGPLCEGQNLNLSASTVTGGSYTWTGPNGFISSLQNPVISNVNKSKAGEYFVVVSVAGCGTSPSTSTNVVVRSVPAAPVPSSNSPVCLGDTIKLDASISGVGPNVSFSWSGPNNFSSGNKQTNINSALSSDAGIYSLAITDSGCTSANATVNIQVRNLPLAPIPSSNSPICAGAGLNLQASSIGSATYSWTGPGGYASNAQNPSISAAGISQAGTYTVRSFVNGCGSIPASVNVIINALPQEPVATNTGPACVGDNITLRASNVLGATYNWSGPNFNSALQNPTLSNVTKLMGGTYAVSATLNGCTSSEGKTDVVVNAIPDVPNLSSDPATAACTGDSLRLYASNLTDGVFDWTGPLGFGSSKQNPVVFISSTAQGGVYSAMVTRYGCASAKATLTIQVHASPGALSINGSGDVKNGETQTYSVNPTPGSTYAWTVNGGTIQSGIGTATIGVLWNVKGNGFVSVKETNAAGCPGVKEQKNVLVGPATGLAQMQQEDLLSLYPNPSSTMLNIRLQNGAGKIESILISNLCGSKLAEYHYAQGGSEQQIQVQDLPAGMYLISVRTENGEWRKQFVRQD